MDLTILQDKKQQLEKEVQENHTKLQQIILEQKEIKEVEKLAQSILEYTEVENQISDRGLLLSLLSQDTDHFKTPYFKAQFDNYLDAAETCSPEIVNFITDIFHEEIREDFVNFKFTDEFHQEYRRHIFPGKILASRFEELDHLVREMNENIQKLEPEYDENLSTQELYEAFKIAIGMNINLAGVKEFLISTNIGFLTEEARKDLLELVEEREKIKEFTIAKDQNVAMERAVKMLEQKQSE